ncbi:MAG: RNA recognition motif-containing protein [Parcubacteria group bacterium Licking1014_17]|nr:MAG: RNA recognition motif-containing protein [Parcubacteria group bacterium Licking1014_17]
MQISLVVCTEKMAKKLYVGGLSYDTTEEKLKEAFAQFGTVESAAVIIDRMSGRSKGFGFVEMSTEEEAQKAIEGMNGKEFDGRTITVNEARPPEARPPRQGGGGGFRGSHGFGGGGYGGN